MKTRTLVAALAGLTLAGMLALTGCSNATTSPESPETDQQASDAAAQFLACLTASDVEARINDSGQVAVKIPSQAGENGAVSSGDGLLGMEGDDQGNTWVIPVDSGYFSDTPDTQDAYEACETKFPDFTQPAARPGGNGPEFDADQKAQEEAALGFAQCARTNGYTHVEDPDFTRANALLVPADLTETDFRALLEVCWDRQGPVFNFGQPLDAPFEAGVVLEEFLKAPAS